jgi:hypothetical protein
MSQSSSSDPSAANRLYHMGHSAKDGAQQKRRERLSGIVQSVHHDLDVMLTPVTFPTASETRFSVREAQNEPGFVSCTRQSEITELAVPGGLFTPSMTEGEREDALTAALFSHKRDPVRRVAKITPYLMVKQR